MEQRLRKLEMDKTELEMDKTAFETKIVDLTMQLNEMSAGFDHLRQQHVQSLDESVKNANTKQHKIDQLQEELAIAQLQVI